MLAGIINQLTDGIELLPPNFSRLKRGTYRFGTKQITIQIQNGQPVGLLNLSIFLFFEY